MQIGARVKTWLKDVRMRLPSRLCGFFALDARYPVDSLKIHARYDFIVAGGQWDSSSGLGGAAIQQLDVVVTRLTGPVWRTTVHKIGVYACRGTVQLKVCVYGVMTNVCCGRAS